MNINGVEIEDDSKLGEAFLAVTGSDHECIEAAHLSALSKGIVAPDVSHVLTEMKNECICQTEDLITLLESKL